MGKVRTEILAILSLRVPRLMLKDIDYQATGLGLRPADVARMALALGLKQMAAQTPPEPQSVAEKLESDDRKGHEGYQEIVRRLRSCAH